MTILEQIQALAMQGIPKSGVEATIGHALDKTEAATFHKAATVRRLKRAQEAKAEKARKRAEAERREKENLARQLAGTAWPDSLLSTSNSNSNSNPSRPLTATERSRLFRERGRELPPIPKPADPWRRNFICRYSLLAFGLAYGMDTYEGMKPLLKRPPSRRMENFVHALQRTIWFGGHKHVRWPRGKGKSTWVKIALMWVSLYGYKRFSVVVEKVKGMGREVVAEVWDRIRLSPAISADFPEFAVPMNDVAFTPQRIRSQTCNGRPTRMKMDIVYGYYRFPTIPGHPHTGAIIAWRGADQALRGINIESSRPDFFFIDDPQTDEDAKNPETVAKIEDNIQGAVLGSGETNERISAVMASTPIEPDDVSERFADPKRHPEWMTETEQFVRRWGDETQRDAFRARRGADHAQRVLNLASSRRFYMERRREIEAGAEMMDDTDFDPATEASAYQHALWLYQTMKHKRFHSEMQMEPRRDETVVSITPRLVLSRIRPALSAAEPPEGTIMICAATDINPSYALTTAVVAFDAMRTATVIDHWRHPCHIPSDISDTEFHNAVYNKLAELAASFRDRGLDTSSRDFHWAIDTSGYQFKSVTRFVFDRRQNRQDPIDVWALRGLDNKSFNPRISSRKFKGVPGWNDTVLAWDEATRLEHVNFNKDKYELTAQRAWLSAVGAPGGLSLYGMRDGRRESHEEFALQVCGEQLKWKPADPDRDRVGFKWDDRAYPRHDYGDCVYMTYALAGFLRLTAEGAPIRPGAAAPRKRRAIVGGRIA